MNDAQPGFGPSPGTLWVVSAPSGAGKTSLTHALIRRLNDVGVAAAFSVSYTTRAPRPGEVDGQDYHFVTPQRFQEMVVEDAFLEHAEVFDRQYGTGRDESLRRLEQDCELFLDIDWQGARQLRRRMPDARSVFILPPSSEELERRLRGRGQDADADIDRRMAQARAEIAHYIEYDALLVNDAFDRALDQMQALVLANRLRLSRQRRIHASLIRALLE